MRRAFIAFGIAVFLVYCWASVAYQNQVDVPGYTNVQIDLLGGMSRQRWESSQQEQFQRLTALENKRYQLPLDAEGDTNRPLTADDFARVIAGTEGAPVLVRLRDPVAIYSLLSLNYLLRDSVMESPDPRAQPIYVGGGAIDKEMLDDLRERGIRTITVSGHAPPVNFQVGTSLMIAVIFFTLVAALKPVLWRPFLAMLEKRRRELEIGAEAERQNQQEAIRFEEEKRKRHAELDRDMQALRLDGQRENARVANGIIREARDREQEVKLAGLRDIRLQADQTKSELDTRVPELAELMAAALTPGVSGDTLDNDAAQQPQ
ncbi:MAG: ATP synthase F0 subunit B [Planctomycetaceae bacterium]|nr:ATP synthase F0 subunit B [Planctomycetaceae bacterium]